MAMFRLLEAREIECRIAQVGKNGDGLSLLLYKDARCDQNILDETVGPMNWQRSHTRDNANCTVSIWDDKKCQWIAKEDTGTESNTEAEKGLASDSFKRACFNWGIGRELYTAPFIWITSQNCNITCENGRYKCFDRFDVTEIGYNDKREICRLKIINEKTHNVVFDWRSGGGDNVQNRDNILNPQSPEPPQRPPRMATEAQKQMIREGLDEKMLAATIRKYGPHFERMTAEAAGQALQMIREAKTA